MNQRGQILPVILAALFFLTTLLVHTVYHSDLLRNKMRAQTTADAAVLSAARVQARSLNAIAYFNPPLTVIRIASEILLTLWAGLQACALGVPNPICIAGLGWANTNGRSILKLGETLGERFAKAQERIYKTTPWLTLEAARHYSNQNNSHLGELKSGLPTEGIMALPKLQIHRTGTMNIGAIDCPKATLTPEKAGDLPSENEQCPAVFAVLGIRLTLYGNVELNNDFAEKQKLVLFTRTDYSQHFLTEKTRRLFRDHLSRAKSPNTGPNFTESTLVNLAQAKPIRTNGRIDKSLTDGTWDATLEPVTLTDHLVTLKPTLLPMQLAAGDIPKNPARNLHH